MYYSEDNYVYVIWIVNFKNIDYSIDIKYDYALLFFNNYNTFRIKTCFCLIRINSKIRIIRIIRRISNMHHIYT